MKVPFIDLKRFESDFQQKWIEKIKQLSADASFIGGQEVHNLENNIISYTGVSHAISCANGTDALQLALRAIGVEKNDIVLVPDLTFWATFESVINVSASPVCVDSDKDGQLDLESVKKAVTLYKPKAIIIAHLFGHVSKNIKELRSLCREQKITLVEDGAQCFGVKYNNESIYKDAMISTVSFYPAKVLGAAGDAGAVLTNCPGLAEKVRVLSNHGRSSHYGYSDVGWNSRMDTFQAAFLNIALDYLDLRIKSRVDSLKTYYRELTIDGLKLVQPDKNVKENGYCNVCLIENESAKRELEMQLRNSQIGFGNIYPGILSMQTGAKKHIDYDRYDTNVNARKFTESVINLPVFPYMTDSELDYVISTVKKCFNK